MNKTQQTNWNAHIDQAFASKRPQPGTPEWLAAKATGPRWSYEDGRGVWHTGYMERFSDHGGTDITYWFRDHITGELTGCSGSRLKAAKRIG